LVKPAQARPFEELESGVGGGRAKPPVDQWIDGRLGHFIVGRGHFVVGRRRPPSASVEQRQRPQP
jgi:hypothetical protein